MKNHFPQNLSGDLIVARECLVDGAVNVSDLSEFFRMRAQFIGDSYEGYTQEDYFKKTLSEFERMRMMSDDSEINLWFEDDFQQLSLLGQVARLPCSLGIHTIKTNTYVWLPWLQGSLAT